MSSLIDIPGLDPDVEPGTGKCSDCGGKVSTQAIMCPHCGRAKSLWHEIRQISWIIKLAAILAALGLIILGILIVYEMS